MTTRFESRGVFVGGRWVTPIDGETIEVRAPFDTDLVIGVFRASESLVPEALDGARAAQRGWSARPLEERIGVIAAFRRGVEEHRDSIAAQITFETGKVAAAAHAEIEATLRKIDLTLEQAPAALERQHAEGVDGYVDQRAHGVFAVIGPYNFPVHLSNGHIVAALVCGNTVVLKPSEVAPGSAELYVRAWDEACGDDRAAAAALSLVQGRGSVGARLAVDHCVNAVAFTGSYDVGVAIQRACAHQPGKLLALELGGRNSAIVFDDADLDRAADDITVAAFGMTGQRCTATSRLFAHTTIADSLLKKIVARTKAMRIGDPFDPSTAIGPLSTAAARDKFDAAQRNTAGLESVVPGSSFDGERPGHWVTPAVHRVLDRDLCSPRDGAEIFGPDLTFDVFDDEEEAFKLANATPFGLSMSVHTAHEPRFERAQRALEAGVIHWNRGTAGASGALPFGGIKRSGNHRPAGSWSLRYCTHPVAVLRGPR